MNKCVAVAFGVAAFVSAAVGTSPAARGQVIYEPVRYQYRAGTTFYYGGSDPQVFACAAQPDSASASFGRKNGFAFVSGNADVNRQVTGERARTFTDAIPLQDASIYGFTPDDARNEAQANLPRYFRKADLIRAGVRLADGTIVVPAEAQPVPEVEQPSSTTRPSPATTTTAPLPAIIIPARPAPPAKRSSDKAVASVN